MPGYWRKVIEARGPMTGRGSFLGPDTNRRARWWELELSCGHWEERSVRYGPRTSGHFNSRRSPDDVLPAPKKIICHRCRRDV